jgi:hypothetical protein
MTSPQNTFLQRPGSPPVSEAFDRSDFGRAYRQCPEVTRVGSSEEN